MSTGDSGIAEEVKAAMRAVVARYPQPRSAMLPCLHLAQEAEGRITIDGVLAVAEALGVNPDEVESVVSFYSMFHTAPQGRYVLKVCTSISCYLRGCDALLDRIEQRLRLGRGETTSDGRFTLGTIECLAACGGAPVLQVNGEFVENVTPERADELLDRLTRDASIADLAARWRVNEAGGFAARSTSEISAAGEPSSGRAETGGSNTATGVRLDVARDVGRKQTRQGPNHHGEPGGNRIKGTMA
jgi:NADH-quinone oxidoreductase E subunit